MSPVSQTVQALCELLKHGDEADRCYSARALGVVKQTAAVAALIERLRDDDIDVCVDAAEALGNIAAAEAAPALIESLENDPSGEICTAVAAALGKIGGDAATDALLKVAGNRPESIEWNDDWDTWWDVQLEAVRALGRFRAPQAVAVLTAILENESEQDIESEILRSLAQIGGDGIDYLITRLQNRQGMPQHRRRAAKALGQSAPDERIQLALGRAMQDEAAEVRAEAVRAIASQGTQRYTRAIILMLRDPAEDVRSAAVDAVTRLASHAADGSEARNELLSLLDDPSSQVRAALFNTLVPQVANNPLSPDEYRTVVNNLRDPGAETAAAACRLLGENGDQAVVPELLNLLNDRAAHTMVRREAALTVGRLGQFDREIADSLSRAIGDQAQPVRLAALSALMALEGAQRDTTETQDDRAPLEIIYAAARGDMDPVEQRPPSRENDPREERSPEPAGDPTQGGGEPAAQTVAAPETADTSSEEPRPAIPHRHEGLTLPDQGARIIREGEVRSAASTLDAIAMDNVDAALEMSAPADQPEHDELTREYLAVVDRNKETMSRIRSNRKINVSQDVRRLAARILAESDADESVGVLVEILNGDDGTLRVEAAESIGRIALRSPGSPALTDALGSLITQLALGDMDQRIACAAALGNLGNQAAIVPLTETLKDDHPNVRIRAIEALCKLVTEGTDPDAADHMVVTRVPPLSVARRILECLEDSEMGVRIAAARSLSAILDQLSEAAFTEQVVDRIIASVWQWSGEESRLIGRILRQFDRSLGSTKLLARLREADSGLQRSVAIEMLEELMKPNPEQPGQAA